MPPNTLHRVLATSTRPLSRPIVPQCAQLTSRRHKSMPYGYTGVKALVYSQYGEPGDVLSLHTHTISPSLPKDHLLLRTLATPINPADINQIQGVYPSKPPFTPLLGTPQPSAVAGNEGCFEILQTGPYTPPSFQKGDWVITKSTNFGTFRTHAVAPSTSVLKIANKEGLTPLQVGTVGVNPITAYRMLDDFEKLREGDWVIQNGANSGVGRAVIQLSKLRGYKTVNVIRERDTPEKTEVMRKELLDLGATHVVTESELKDRSFYDKIKTWTSGGRESIKLGLNCVGGKSTEALVKHLSPNAHLVTYGAMSKQPLALPAGVLIFKNIKFSGFWVSRWADQFPEEKIKTVEEILDLIRNGQFKDVPVDQVRWDWDTEEKVLKEAVQGTLGGFRAGKGVFVFGDT